MFKKLLVLHGITEAAFSYTVCKSLQMSLSGLPCVFSQSPVTCPRRAWEEFPQTLLTIS